MAFIIISEDDFLQLVSGRCQTLLRAARYFADHDNRFEAMTRPLLGELLSQATQIEELLDSYGARSNLRWHSFRSFTAAIKLFSNVCYELLHIQHVLPAYRLLPVERDFVKATEETLIHSGQVLKLATKRILSQAQKLGMELPAQTPSLEIYCEHLPPGRLPHDLSKRKIDTVSRTVTMLATAFLNLAAESKQELPVSEIHPEDYTLSNIGPVCEETLRSLELRFHNLQSMYDTYVSTTEIEGMDEELPVLRGHISVVFHLLRIATDYSHYYERHVSIPSSVCAEGPEAIVKSSELLGVLANYPLYFVIQYLTCAQYLCQGMLKRYAQTGQLEVGVPPYRGFHVRPATLISKLVLHYGSSIQMELEGELYDAASPLELFRANETINAQKRRRVAAEIMRLNLVEENIGQAEFNTIVRNVIIALVDSSELVIYEHPLTFDEKPIRREGKLLQQVVDEIGKLQMMGKIDIATNIKVRFKGDKRVLNDIKLLAECGYGEDSFGNNLPLPDSLKYLRK